MKKLIIGNWKLNPQTLKAAVTLARATDKRGVILCPPHLFLEEISHTLKKALPCAQDISLDEKSFTGGVSVNQLKTLRVKHTLIGHSSRRTQGETDEEINQKMKIALKEKITPILCVGESISTHRKGTVAVKQFVTHQIKKALNKIPSDRKFIIAYEPIWAIGTKRPDTPEESGALIAHIKELTKKMGKKNIKVLYGGSVNGKNAGSFLRQKNIDGLLVGMASLNAKEFNKIIKTNG